MNLCCFGIVFNRFYVEFVFPSLKCKFVKFNMFTPKASSLREPPSIKAEYKKAKKKRVRVYEELPCMKLDMNNLQQFENEVSNSVLIERALNSLFLK